MRSGDDQFLPLPIEGNVGNGDQDKNVKRLVDHHTHPLQIALTIKTHPEIGQVRGIDQPMRDKDDGADDKVKPQVFVPSPGEPQGADDDRSIDGKVHRPRQGKQASFLALGHPIVLQKPIAYQVAEQ